MITRLALLALSGAAGTLARFGLHTIYIRLSGHSSWWGTLFVNTVGCLLAGLLWGWVETRGTQVAAYRLPLLIGFLGAFTTFSAMMLDTGEVARTATWLHAGGWLLLQNALGLAALVAGLAISSHA